MKKYIFISFIFILSAVGVRAQNFLKNASDTAFALDHVYFPQLQIKLSIAFLTSDFAQGVKKRIKISDIDSLKKLITKQPAKGDHYINLSSVLNEFHRTQEADSMRDLAKDIFINDLIANAADTHAVRNLANIYLGDLQFELASSYFQELTHQVPNASCGWSGLALINMAAYNFGLAVQNMEKAITSEPDNIENYCQMANILMMKSIFDLDAYDSVTMDTLTYRSIINTKFLKESLTKKPNDPSLSAMLDALTLSAIIYKSFLDNSEQFTGHEDTIHFRLKPDVEKALAEIEKHMTAWTSGTFRDREFPYTCLMLINFLRNDPEKAYTWFTKGVKYSPRSQSLYENMTGITALGLRKDLSYRLQLKLDSIHPTAGNLLMTAFFYYLDKKFPESQQWAEKALALEPNNFNVLMGMAALYARNMKFPACAMFLDKAAGINPDDADIALLTGILYLFDNSPNMAKQAFNELVSSGQNATEARSLLLRFFP